MKLPVPLFIGLRYTRSRRRNQFISFVSGFSLLGMALGTLALIVVMSVMNGFDREIKQRLLQVIPHLEVLAPLGLENWQDWVPRLEQDADVLAAAAFISRDAMVSFDQGMQGVQIRGLRAGDIERVSRLHEHMLLGQIDALQPGQYNIIIGRLLARYLGLNPGDKLSITLPQLTVTPAGVFPRVRRFTVVGVFEVGGQLDQNLVLMDLQDAQRLFRMGSSVDGLQLETRDRYSSAAVGQRIWSGLPADLQQRLQIRDWSNTQGSLFSAIRMEKTVVSTLLMIVIAVAAFNIVSSLVLMVADKRSDIAVLRTMGLGRRGVMLVFITQGFAVGLVGIALGACFGALIAVEIGPLVAFIENITGMQIFDPNVYFISHMPSQLLWNDVLVVVLAGILLSLVSTLYPAYRASTVAPAEALRYE